MAKRRIGLDIGATGVRAAELSMGGSPPSLVRAGQVALPADAVANGEVKDPAVVGEALRELWRRAKLRGREVILGVANQRVVVREVSVPWLEEKELRASLALQVQEYVPIPLEDAVLDYTVLEEIEREGRRMVKLLIVAAQKAMIGQVLAAVEAAKLRPVGLDLIPFAIVRSVGTVDGLALEDQAGDEAVVDIGSDMTSICVHAMGTPRFVRILQTAGSDITAAVAAQMGVDREVAERLKKGDVQSDEPTRADEATHAATSVLASFADEVHSSLDFYLTQSPGARIGRILVTGGGSKMQGLIPFLAERFAGEVAPGHAFRRVRPALDLPADRLSEVEPLLAVAVGLAIPGAAA